MYIVDASLTNAEAEISTYCSDKETHGSTKCREA